MKLHGVVTGLAPFGVFVGFYGGVAGLMTSKELDLLPGQQAGDVYSVGQLVRVQVRTRIFLQLWCTLDDSPELITSAG
jgi:ribosomal protein S1